MTTIPPAASYLDEIFQSAKNLTGRTELPAHAVHFGSPFSGGEFYEPMPAGQGR